MDIHIVTGISIVLIIVGVAAWDFFLLKRHGKDATITRVFRGWTRKFPLLIGLLAFAMGALYGHFFLCPECSGQSVVGVEDAITP